MKFLSDNSGIFSNAFLNLNMPNLIAFSGLVLFDQKASNKVSLATLFLWLNNKYANNNNGCFSIMISSYSPLEFFKLIGPKNLKYNSFIPRLYI